MLSVSSDTRSASQCQPAHRNNLLPLLRPPLPPADVPNAVATLAIPTAIFDIDVRPKVGGPPTGPRLLSRGDVCKSSYDGTATTVINPFSTCGC